MYLLTILLGIVIADAGMFIVAAEDISPGNMFISNITKNLFMH